MISNKNMCYCLLTFGIHLRDVLQSVGQIFRENTYFHCKFHYAFICITKCCHQISLSYKRVSVSLRNVNNFTYLYYLSDPLSQVAGENLKVTNGNRTRKSFLNC